MVNHSAEIERQLLVGQPPGTIIKSVTAQVIQTPEGLRIVLQGIQIAEFTQQQLALVQHEIKQQLLKTPVGKLLTMGPKKIYLAVQPPPSDSQVSSSANTHQGQKKAEKPSASRQLFDSQSENMAARTQASTSNSSVEKDNLFHIKEELCESEDDDHVGTSTISRIEEVNGITSNVESTSKKLDRDGFKLENVLNVSIKEEVELDCDIYSTAKSCISSDDTTGITSTLHPYEEKQDNSQHIYHELSETANASPFHHNGMIDKLLTKPFTKLSHAEKLEVKRLGRPLPNLDINQKIGSDRTARQYKRVFSSSYYEKYDWLCGCEVRSKLFCFPCVLFGGDGPFAKSGFGDLNHLVFKAKQHENSTSHIKNVTQYSFFGKNNQSSALSEQLGKDIIEHNRKVSANRYVLNAIINCIKFCGLFNLATRGYNETDYSSDHGIFRGLINFSAELDSGLRTHIESAPFYSDFSKTVQTEILECMLKVCQEQIKSEINAADCFAIIMDETSDASNVYQLAVVFRYLLNGKPVERFYKFIKPSGRNAESLTDAIDAVLSEIPESKEKLVAQTMDGAIVCSSEQRGVQSRIKTKYRKASYFHCYGRNLFFALSKAVTVNRATRVFFANVEAIFSFFSQSPLRKAVLDEIIRIRLPSAGPTRWHTNSRSVREIYENKEDIIKCMKKLSCESFNSSTIQQATAFANILLDSEFNFWLRLFYPLMIQVDILSKYLQSRGADPVGVKREIEKFEQKVDEIRKRLIEETTAESNKSDGERPCKRLRRDDEPDALLLKQAEEVCSRMIEETKKRFAFTGYLSAASLLNNENFINYNNDFPHKMVKEVAQLYDLDESRLNNELEVFYQTDGFGEVSDALSIVSVINNHDLSSTFREVKKLCTILATCPISYDEKERGFPALERIEAFLRNCMGHDRLDALAMLTIEKEMVHKIRDFNERVIDYFAVMKDRRIDLIYK